MKVAPRDARLWRCPACNRTFANLNRTHTCRPVRSLDEHSAGKLPVVRQPSDRVLAVVEAYAVG